MLRICVVGVACLLTLTSCGGESNTTERLPWQGISGRDEGNAERDRVYRVRVPSEWTRRDPDSHVSITDTMLALCSFDIEDPAGAVHIAVHNFPAESMSDRIPPGAQVSRWRQQLGLQDPLSYTISPCSHGGFTGLCLQGDGHKEDSPTAILAWAMQIGTKHFRSLETSDSTVQSKLFHQMRGDYTIKATGPKASLERHQDAIVAFARSFELIEEIPTQ